MSRPTCACAFGFACLGVKTLPRRDNKKNQSLPSKREAGDRDALNRIAGPIYHVPINISPSWGEEGGRGSKSCYNRSELPQLCQGEESTKSRPTGLWNCFDCTALTLFVPESLKHLSIRSTNLGRVQDGVCVRACVVVFLQSKREQTKGS